MTGSSILDSAAAPVSPDRRVASRFKVLVRRTCALAALGVLPALSPLVVAAEPMSPAQGDLSWESLLPAPELSAAPPVLVKKLERKRSQAARPGKPYDQPREAQEFFLLKRVPAPGRPLPVARYHDAFERMRRMPRHSTRGGGPAPPSPADPAESAAALDAWTPLGPGNVGGRTRVILIDPSSPSTMYAAGVAGGVWKTTNTGASWTPLSDLIANIAVNSMAMDPWSPNVIYAGTGEGYFNIDGVRGAGIFKTTDGGATWTRLASTNTSDFYYVNKIVVSPNNPQRVYAATRTGVWRSLDGGGSWSQVLPSAITGGCLDLAIRTDQPTDYLFTSCGTFVQATIHRNTDAGGPGAWVAVYTEPSMGRTSLAIAPSSPATIYAVSASLAAGSYQHGLHAVFRSQASGEPGTWTAQVRNTSATKLDTVLLTNPIFAFYGECFGGPSQFYNQGWYDNVIAVDPTDPDRVWVGGIDLFRSDNGGVSWGLASYWWADPGDPHYSHADHHAIVFHPQYNGTTNRIMFNGNDGGVFRTGDARAPTATGSTAPCSPAKTGLTWTNLNNGYGVTQFYHGVPYPGGTTYFGGTQDNGTVRGTDAVGPNGWAQIQGGDGGYVAVDPGNTDVLYAEYTGLSIQKSTNGGASWSDATSGITNDSGFLFIAPFIMDPGSAQRLWTGGWYIWRTTNGASSWSRASTLTAGSGSVSALAVAPTDPNRALVGMSDGWILRNSAALTANPGTDWPAVRPRSGYVSWLAFDPTDANIVYATYSTFGGTHVWKSMDSGASWVGIDGTDSTAIPDIPVHSIVVDPTTPSRLYVGTDLGVFVSRDGGASWAVENTGFANVITEALAVGTVATTPNIFAFTHGRGAWRVPTADEGPTAKDLVITAPAVTPGSGPAGSWVQVGYEVLNQGTATVTEGYTERVYLSASPGLDGTAVPLAIRQPGAEGPLGAGATQAFTQGVQIPAGTAPGPYYVLVQADALGTVSEGDEGNNVSAVAFAVSPPTTCPAEVIVDNLAPGQSSAQVSFTGTWVTSGAPGAYGANASLESAGAGVDTYTWRTGVLSATEACTYRVGVGWTSAPTRGTAVPYTVSGQTGGAVTKTFDQRTLGGQLLTHGTYTYPAGAEGVVTVSDVNGEASADVVIYTRVDGTDATPPPLPGPPAPDAPKKGEKKGGRKAGRAR